MEEGSARTNSLPPNWIIHSNQDGSASYYYNTVTGETRTTYPYDARYYENDSDQDSTTSTIDSNPKLEAHINSQNDGNVIVNDNDEALVQQLLDSKKKVVSSKNQRRRGYF
jgi:hypothetical protein